MAETSSTFLTVLEKVLQLVQATSDRLKHDDFSHERWKNSSDLQTKQQKESYYLLLHQIPKFLEVEPDDPARDRHARLFEAVKELEDLRIVPDEDHAEGGSVPDIDFEKVWTALTIFLPDMFRPLLEEAVRVERAHLVIMPSAKS